MKADLTDSENRELFDAMRTAVYPKHAGAISRIERQIDEQLDRMIEARKLGDDDLWAKAVTNRRSAESALDEALAIRHRECIQFCRNWKSGNRSV